MAITRKNKFDAAVEELNQQETAAQEKSHAVLKSIAGETADTKLVHDKNGRIRKLKVKEQRKAFQVYLPLSVFNDFDDMVSSQGLSRNSAIEQLVRGYNAGSTIILSKSMSDRLNEKLQSEGKSASEVIEELVKNYISK